MKGEAKRDYPASIFFQSAWYPEYRNLEDYFSRINVLMADADPVCGVLVINPIAVSYTHLYPYLFTSRLRHPSPQKNLLVSLSLPGASRIFSGSGFYGPTASSQKKRAVSYYFAHRLRCCP